MTSSFSSSPSDTPLNERQSLDLIQTMIRQAQNRFTDDGSHLLWWGTLVPLAALGHYALLRTPWADHAGYVWILMVVGGIGGAIIGHRQAQRQLAKTFVDRVMGGLWGSVGTAIGLVFLLVVLTSSWRVMYPVILTLYGIGLLASSVIVRFRPLLVGGLVCWALAVAAAMVAFEGQLLCLAGAGIAGFLVPGILTRMRFQHTETTAPDAAHAV